ncbi:unnamed protein product [Symbiodinium necroappetens]|uniref:Tyr recombinase domain-containing protein n=1 Tax=Symbiodinium necroappetens TaxID=1628268 RepID=A0A813AVE3_9DINO|nr:unnamed protein product [Symbiodinium necroappetens]
MADLRSEKWILVKREGHVAVFRAGNESQAIPPQGLYVPVEADLMRGDKEIADACKGYDKVHLCRDFDGERFHDRIAELGAEKVGRTLWRWLRAAAAKPAKVLKEFGSESETEEYDERGSIDLCPKHALDYEGRRAQKCYQSQCNQVSEYLTTEFGEFAECLGSFERCFEAQEDGAERGGVEEINEDGLWKDKEDAAYVQIDAQPVRPFSGDIGAHVDEWIEENICGYHAESTSKQYNIRSGRPTKTSCWDSWDTLDGLERRLPVTPNMLTWVAQRMGPHLAATAEKAFDATMVLTALNTAWFFMLRAKEYCKSNGMDYGMVLRGANLSSARTDLEDYATLQFRKTKTDQEAFGRARPCIGLVLQDYVWPPRFGHFVAVAPQRFGAGPEALKPLFRWANSQMLRRTQVQHLLQRAAAGVGLPPERFMSHSLRTWGFSFVPG